MTQDGFADSPENIRIKCFTQNQKQQQQNPRSKDSSLDIQPLIQYSTSSGEQSSFESQPNFKYQREQHDDSLVANDDESNEQSGQNLLTGGRSSPTAELLKWPLAGDNDANDSNQPTAKQVNKRSTKAFKNHRIRKHRKAKRSIDVDSRNDSLVNQTESSTQFRRPALSNDHLGPQNDQQTNESDNNQNFVTINWEPPFDARGTVLGWNITLDGLSRYINEKNKEITERFKLIYEIRSNITNEFTVRVNANTRYQVRMCAVNKAGCGKLSSFSLNSQCDSAPTLDKNRFQNLQAILSRRTSPMINNYAHISPASHSSSTGEQELTDSSSNKNNLNIQFAKNDQLVLNLPRLNERDGRILCYRIVMIRLPKYRQLINQLNLYESNRQSNATISKQNSRTNSSLTSNSNQTVAEQASSNNESHLLSESSTDSKVQSLNMSTGRMKVEQDSNSSNNLKQQSDEFDSLSILPSDPMQLPVYRYEQFNSLNYSFNDHPNLQPNRKLMNTAKNSMYLAYLAKEMSSNQFQSEIVIGDKTESSCSAECIPNDILPYTSSRPDNGSFYAMAHRSSSSSPVASARSTLGRRCVYNGELEPETNYTGFVEIHVAGLNGSRLVQRSGYFKPISTGSQPQLITTQTTFKTATKFTNQFDKLSTLFGSMSDHTAAIVFGAICGLTLLLLLFLCFVLCCLKRKVSSNRNQSSPKLVEKPKTKKSKSSKKQKQKKKINNKEDTLTDLDRAYSEERLDEPPIKLDENEIIEHDSPTKNHQSTNHPTCMELDCENNYVMNDPSMNDTIKRQCCFNEPLSIETNDCDNQWQQDAFPPPPSCTATTQPQLLTHQQQMSSYQQPAILIDTTNQPPSLLTSTTNPIHFLHLKQPTNDLASLYEQSLANNLININNHLNYDAYSSVLPSYNCTNHIESSNNYCINNFTQQHQQASLDNESTTNSISVNNSSLNDNESDNQLTAHKWITAEFSCKFPMKSIHEVFLERHENDDQLFQIEFNLIPVQFQDRTFNQNSVNKTKNRFQNIKCFNETRVKLGLKTVSFSQTICTMPRQSSTTSNSSSGGGGFSSTLSRTLRRKKKANSIDSNDTSSSNSSSTNGKKQDDCSTTSNSPSILSNSQQSTNSDYIHANHVQLNDSSYICTQAPLENTIKDYWQMVIEQNINIIVALCDLEEDGRQVCSSYWNESNVDNGLKQVSFKIK